MLMVTWCHSARCVPSGPDLEAAGDSVVFVKLFALRASSSCKHDMGALSWLNTETLEIASTPLFAFTVICYYWKSLDCPHNQTANL